MYHQKSESKTGCVRVWCGVVCLCDVVVVTPLTEELLSESTLFRRRPERHARVCSIHSQYSVDFVLPTTQIRVKWIGCCRTSIVRSVSVSTDVRAGRLRRIARGESRLLQTNATGGCLAYHTESLKQTNMYGNRSISSPDIRRCYRQLTSVASYHDSAMSVVMIRCQRSYYDEQCMVYHALFIVTIVVAQEDRVNNGRTTSTN